MVVKGNRTHTGQQEMLLNTETVVSCLIATALVPIGWIFCFIYCLSAFLFSVFHIINKGTAYSPSPSNPAV